MDLHANAKESCPKVIDTPSLRIPDGSTVAIPPLRRTAPHQAAREPHLAAAENPQPISGEPLPKCPAAPTLAQSARRHQVPDPQGRNAASLARSFPTVRRPEQTSGSGMRRSSEPRQQGSADFPSNHAPAAPSTQASVIVVKQDSAHAVMATSIAFWERRHLTHLSVRIRR